MRGTLRERFWAKVNKAGPNDCWLWTAAVGTSGYGLIGNKSKVLSAHRVAYRLAYGLPLPTLYVMHRCDNRICVNPKHLFLGTHLDNIRDMDEKGRRAVGVDHGNASLNPDKVCEIRKLRAQGMQYTEIAPLFGISITAARSAAIGSTWKHVQAQPPVFTRRFGTRRRHNPPDAETRSSDDAV